MNQFIFIIIIIVILILFKFHHLNESFNILNHNQNQLAQNTHAGIYNYFFLQVLNPYKYPMTPFFSNDSQEPPKPSPPHPDY